MSRARDIVDALRMIRHPERGHYSRTYESPWTVQADGGRGARAASTAIYFLLTDAERFTYLHRLRSDELFHLYEGGPLDVLLLAPDGQGKVARLGLDLAAGERPQLVIPAGTWFAAELPEGVPYCLWGCTVAPGFDFADFELARGPELANEYPQLAARIQRLSRG